MNSHFASITITDARVSDECLDVIVSISHFTVPKALPFLGYYIVKIINVFLTSGTLLEHWKECLLVALQKKATPSAPLNF